MGKKGRAGLDDVEKRLRAEAIERRYIDDGPSEEEKLNLGIANVERSIVDVLTEVAAQMTAMRVQRTEADESASALMGEFMAGLASITRGVERRLYRVEHELRELSKSKSKRKSRKK